MLCIVLKHYMPIYDGNNTLVLMAQRGWVRDWCQLDLFAVMSGFSIHHSFAHRDLPKEGCRALALYSLSRLERVVFTTWVAMALDLLPQRAPPYGAPVSVNASNGYSAGELLSAWSGSL